MKYLRPAIIALAALAVSLVSGVTEVKAQTVTDSLQSGSLDPAKWETWLDSFGSIEPLPDGLHMTILPDSDGELYSVGVNFECTVIGDYDASIDFELLTWPTGGQMHIGLMQNFVGNMRGVEPGGGQYYYVDIKGSTQLAWTTDTAGSLRLNRTGTVVTAYYWDTATGWVALHSLDDPDFAKRAYIAFQMWGHWATTGAEVAWRNFSITADTLNCPDTSQPFTPTFTIPGDSSDANDPEIVPTGDTCLVGLPCKMAPGLHIPAGQALNGPGDPSDVPALMAFEVARGPDVPIGTVVGRISFSIGSDLASSDSCATSLDVSVPLVNAAIPARDGGGPDGTGFQGERGSANVWPIQFDWQPQVRYWLDQGAQVWSRYQAIWPDVSGTGATGALNWIWLKTQDQRWQVVSWTDIYTFIPSHLEVCSPLDGRWNFLGETEDGSNWLLRCIEEGTHEFDISYYSQWGGDPVPVSDTLTCVLPDFADDDYDGVENSVDGRYVDSSFIDESGTPSDDFTDQHLAGGTTYGSIVNRGAVDLQVLDEAEPRGVRLKAEGTGQAAEVDMCGGTIVYLEGGNQVVVTCGSTEIIVTQGNPVKVLLGTMTAQLPAGSYVMITETGPNTFTVENLNPSWVPVVVAGVVLEPGEDTLVGDDDFDGLRNSADACPETPGLMDRQGCPIGDHNVVELHVIDQAKSGACADGAGSCRSPLADAEVRVFDRNNSEFQAAYGTKNPSGSIYDQVFENDIGRVGACSTDAAGQCTAGEETIGDYLVIVKHVDTDAGKTVYTGKPKSPEDFDTTGLASKDFQVIKVLKKNGGIQISGGSKTVVMGSYLEIVSPDYAIWDDVAAGYVYPFIFTSDSDWGVDLCAEVPAGYEIVGVYDDTGDLVSGVECVQAFVAGETKVVAFEVIEVGSPEPVLRGVLAVAHEGTVTEVDVEVPGTRAYVDPANLPSAQPVQLPATGAGDDGGGSATHWWLAAVAASTLVAIAAATWYARRRWLP